MSGIINILEIYKDPLRRFRTQISKTAFIFDSPEMSLKHQIKLAGISQCAPTIWADSPFNGIFPKTLFALFTVHKRISKTFNMARRLVEGHGNEHLLMLYRLLDKRKAPSRWGPYAFKVARESITVEELQELIDSLYESKELTQFLSTP